MSVRCKDNRYIIDYYPHGAVGRRIRVTLPAGTTHAQAIQIEKDLRNRKKTAQIASQDDRIARLITYYYHYIDMNLSLNTRRDIRNCFKNHIIPYFGNMRVSELVTPLLSTYQKVRRDKPAMRDREQRSINRSINKELSYFSAFLKWAELETCAVPSTSLRYRPLPYKRPLPNIMTSKEVHSIVNAAVDHYKGIFMAIAHLGLRITSARMLKWTDVDMATRTATIHGKGNKTLMLPLSDELYKWLKEKKNQNAYNSPWLFPSRTRPLHPITDIRKALQRAAGRAGVAKRVHPHLFRHSAGAHLIESGVDLRTVQEILGHSDVRMTEWYTQVVMKTKREALTKAGHIRRKKSSQK